MLRAYVYVDGERVALLQAAEAGPSGLFFVHNDHLGTPKAVTDAAQNIVWAASHTPFGTALVSVNQVENRFRFPGQYFDPETGLHYNYFRDYDPGTGRYIESDPIGLIGGTNTFAYAGGNPIANVDPTGLFLPALAIPVVEGFINTIGAIVILANSGIFSGDDPSNLVPFPDKGADVDPKDDNCPPNDPCEQLYAQIDRLVNQLQRRFRELRENRRNLPASGSFSVGTHQQQFRQRQAQLRKLLNGANTKGCIHYRSDAWKWASMPAPSPAG